MKIGFDAKRATQNFTGLGNYSRFVIKNLLKFYPENTYELYSPKPSVYKAHIFEGNNIKVIQKKGFRPFWRTYWINKDIKKSKLDLYHGLSNELPFGIKRTGVRSIVTIHDLIFLRHPEFYPLIDRIIYNIKAAYACKVADRIIAVSECTKRDIIKYYKINPDKIDVVYQGCFPIFKNIESEDAKNNVRLKYNLPDKFLLFIGSIIERKNILLIVKALKDVRDVHFVAIGKQKEYAEKVKAYAKENKLEDRLHLISDVPLEDLPAILQSSEIFIYTSIYEGFGIPIIEAMSSKIPVIAATGSCLEEAGGPDTIYVDPYDEKQLAQAIIEVLDSSELRERMIEKGLEYVDKFSDEKCTNNLIDKYKKTME